MGPVQTVSSCGLNLQTIMILPVVILPLVISPLSVLVSMPLRALMFVFMLPTNFVKMMKKKKIARSESSNFDSTIPISLAILRRMVFALISHFSEYKN